MDKKQQHFQYFYSLNLFTWLCIITGVVLFTLGRALLLISYGSPALYSTHRPDLIQSFRTGFIYDLKTMAILCSPFFLLSYTGFLWKTTQPFAIFSQCYQRIQVILLSLCCLLVIINHFFFGAYHTALDANIQSLWNGQTKIILHAIWAQFPVIKLMILWIVATLSCRWLVKRYYQRTFNSYFTPNTVVQIIYLLIALGFYGLVVRGSISSHALTLADTRVSRHPMINQMTLNPVAAFYNAITHTASTSE